MDKLGDAVFNRTPNARAFEYLAVIFQSARLWSRRALATTIRPMASISRKEAARNAFAGGEAAGGQHQKPGHRRRISRWRWRAPQAPHSVAMPHASHRATMSGFFARHHSVLVRQVFPVAKRAACRAFSFIDAHSFMTRIRL